MIKAAMTAVVALVSFGSGVQDATAQTYIAPIRKGMKSGTGQNPILHGQPVDLSMKTTVQFLSEDCPLPHADKILLGALVTVELSWAKAKVWPNVVPQIENASTRNGDDMFTLQWNNSAHWTLDHAQALAPSSPISFDGIPIVLGNMVKQGGAGKWTGLKFSPPGACEVNPGTTRITIRLKYTRRPNDGCKVFGIQLRGHYVHTYTFLGALQPWRRPAVTIGAAFPWRLGAAGGPAFGFDFAWVKPLFPGGNEPVYTTPPNYVPVVECCGQAVVVPPKKHGCEFRGEGSCCPGGVYFVDCVVTPDELPVDYVEISCRSKDGLVLSEQTYENESASPQTFSYPVQVPHWFDEDTMVLHASAFDTEGDVATATFDVEMQCLHSPSYSTGSGLGDGRVITGDSLLVRVPAPFFGATHEDVALSNPAMLMNQYDEIVDQEFASSVEEIDGEFLLEFPVEKASASAAENNGVLEALNGDTIQVLAWSEAFPEQECGLTIPVTTHPDALNFSGENAFSTGIDYMTKLMFEGEATGDHFEIYLDATEGAEPLTVQTTPGQTGAEVAAAVVNAINSFPFGPAATIVDGNGIKFLSEADMFFIHRVDGGIDLIPEGSVVEDIDADGLINGVDLACILGAWNTSDAQADVNGDGIVDGVDLAMVLGAWSGI